jgi:hypothetical protein
LKHLIEDHLYPEPERDRRHYEEFFRLALPTPDSQVDERVRRAFDEKADCHFHVWNHETFLEMINYVNGLVGWSSVWSHPTLPDVENDIEFYFRLTK